MRNLVFYFYGFDGYKDNRAIKIHFKCLKKYCNVFDNALFIISVNDITNIKLISDIEHDLINCGFNNISFKIHQNDVYCEANVFKEEIVNKLNEYEGITFFGHTKGVSNYTEETKDSMDEWITSMYFFNLEYTKNIEGYLAFDVSLFYGHFLSRHLDGLFYYNGTFFWINTKKLYHHKNVFNIHDDENVDGRGYAELYPSYFYNDELMYLDTFECFASLFGDNYVESIIINDRMCNYTGKLNVLSDYRDFKKEIIYDI